MRAARARGAEVPHTHTKPSTSRLAQRRSAAPTAAPGGTSTPARTSAGRWSLTTAGIMGATRTTSGRRLRRGELGLARGCVAGGAIDQKRLLRIMRIVARRTDAACVCAACGARDAHDAAAGACTACGVVAPPSGGAGCECVVSEQSYIKAQCSTPGHARTLRWLLARSAHVYDDHRLAACALLTHRHASCASSRADSGPRS